MFEKKMKRGVSWLTRLVDGNNTFAWYFLTLVLPCGTTGGLNWRPNPCVRRRQPSSSGGTCHCRRCCRGGRLFWVTTGRMHQTSPSGASCRCRSRCRGRWLTTGRRRRTSSGGASCHCRLWGTTVCRRHTSSSGSCRCRSHCRGGCLWE